MTSNWQGFRIWYLKPSHYTVKMQLVET